MFFAFKDGKSKFYKTKSSNYFFESIALHWATYIAQVFIYCVLIKKKWTGTYKKEINVVIDEVEPFDFFIEKKWFFRFKS